ERAFESPRHHLGCNHALSCRASEIPRQLQRVPWHVRCTARRLFSRQKEGSMKIKDVMVQDVVSINPSASLAEAAQLMRQANVGILPVVEEGQVCGVITDRDLVVRAIAIGADLPSTPVGECATGD